MLDSLSLRQWQEWVAYLGKFGLPEMNQDARVIDTLIVQANMNREKGKPAADLVYFEGEKFGKGEKETPAQRMEHIRKQMQSLAKKK